ncbi:acyltransferase [Kosmotoga arenicorallina S304]|uniref:Apolipoprotein N-acyltransferase n=1 Tax=Kosmotoga arenicorallina S304 TaxID=1453497 RepID=A0A176K425_9BACT|nr:apolipoprotein N-acyltransferase [Kosmotoga arenicorallina]OAA31867.1 acyltransferase [Kosmotoga arenicorallina S304]
MVSVLLSALATAFSMPGMLWGGVIWIALIPFLLDLEKGGLWKGTFKAFLYAYTYLMICHFWVLPVLSINVPEVLSSFPSFVGVLSFFLMGILMSFPFLGFGFLYKLYAHKFSESMLLSALFTASLFTLFDWLRSLGQLGFTGGSLADAFVNQKGLLQLSSFGGPYLLVFLVVFVNAMLVYAIKRKRKQKITFILATLSVIFALNMLVENFLPVPIENPMYDKKIVAIQTNIPQSLKYNESPMEVYSIIEKALKEIPEGDFAVLPEASFLYDIRNSFIGDKLQEISKERNLTMLIGFPAYENGQRYNQLRLLGSDGFSNEFYAKMKPTPFAEFLPYPKLFGMFKFMRFLDFFSPGEVPIVFEVGNQRIGSQICFDSYYPEVTRDLVNAGSYVILISTNDGWFNFQTGLVQHLSKAILRAVENRRYVIQVSNTGISAVVDPFGRIIKRLPTSSEWQAEYIIGDFHYLPRADRSFYTEYGDWFVYVLIAIVFFMILAGVFL